MTQDPSTRVVVTDLHMPFWSMVRFMVKWAIAAIPALIILAVIGALLSTLFTAIVGYTQNRKMVEATAPTTLAVAATIQPPRV